MFEPTKKRTRNGYRFIKSGRYAPKPSAMPAVVFFLMLVASLVFSAISQ